MNGSQQTAAVVPLRPVRILLVGRDRRFLRTASVLLSRRGCEVIEVRRPSQLLAHVERERPDVVVLDGSDSLNATARTVAALESLARRVHTLVVYESGEQDALRDVRLLPKWGSFDEIVLEVERLHASAETAPAATGSARA